MILDLLSLHGDKSKITLDKPRSGTILQVQGRQMGVVTVSAAEQVVGPSRIAEIGEGISQDELQLAGRNHGMPLEAMRYDVTPIGLHYLLIHYDIPAVDAASWRLEVGGCVSR